ncbi:unnamed protein product [Mucor circinelloides]
MRNLRGSKKYTIQKGHLHVFFFVFSSFSSFFSRTQQILIMGNCCGSESQEVENHQIKPIKNTTKSKAKGAGQTLGGASASPSNVDSEGSREAMLSAAEKRRVQAENRGVKEGGKLSKQLADEKKQKNQPLSPRDEADDRLVWD